MSWLTLSDDGITINFAWVRKMVPGYGHDGKLVAVWLQYSDGKEHYFDGRSAAEIVAFVAGHLAMHGSEVYIPSEESDDDCEA